MKKGGWLTSLNLSKGSEQSGVRLFFVVSRNLLNTYSEVVWVSPLVTKLKAYKGNVILILSKVIGLTTKPELTNLHLLFIAKKRLLLKLGVEKPLEIANDQKGMKEILAFV